MRQPARARAAALRALHRLWARRLRGCWPPHEGCLLLLTPCMCGLIISPPGGVPVPRPRVYTRSSPPAKAAVKAVAEDEGEDAGETSTSADTVAEEAGETSTSADTVVEEAGATAAAEAGAAAAASDAEIAQHEHDAGADDAAGETSASVEGQVAAAAAEGGDADMPDYFHADLSKKAADELVSSDDNAKNLFLVRNSKDQGEWFLSVTYKGKPTHHKLKRESEGVLSLNSMVSALQALPAVSSCAGQAVATCNTCQARQLC